MQPVALKMRFDTGIAKLTAKTYLGVGMHESRFNEFLKQKTRPTGRLKMVYISTAVGIDMGQ